LENSQLKIPRIVGCTKMQKIEVQLVRTGGTEKKGQVQQAMWKCGCLLGLV
jgi:hypothetical protein